MKLKEIKKHTYVHCKTIQEAIELSKVYSYDKTNYDTVNYWDKYKDNTLYNIDKLNVDDKNFYICGYLCTDYRITNDSTTPTVEFSDLIISDEEELTAAEAIKLEAEICSTHGCDNCYLRNKSYLICDEWKIEHPEEVIEVLKQYKKTHSPIQPKEPEIEWGYEGNGKFFYTEEEARKYVEEYAIKSYKETGKAMMYYFDCIKACRVKES